MTTRRDFIKGLSAASLMPATLPAFAKFYYGMDFGSGGSTTVWHKVIPSDVYLRGGRHSGYRPMHDYWRWALEQVSDDDLAGSRCSPKTIYAPPSKRKPKAEDQKSKLDKLRWLWFEEASEFANQG
jgi:hypothetical protein